MRRQTMGRGRAPKQPVAAPPPPDVPFPLMTVGELMDDMELFEYPLEASVVKSPRPSDVYEIYSFFLRELYGDNVELMLRPDPNATENYEYPELFPKSVLERLHLLKSLRKMFEEACYNEFSLTDLEAPEPMKFRYQLSALVNYAKYRRSRLELMDELAAKEDQVTSKHEELSMGLEKLKAEISAIEAARLEEQPQAEEEERIIKELREKHNALDNQRVELTKYTGERKLELNVLKERVVQLEERQMQTQSEVAANKRLIVASPQRAMSEIRELESELQRAKDAVNAARKVRSGYDARRKTLSGTVEPLRSCTTLAEKVAQKRKQVTETKQRLAKGEARERRANDAIHEADGELARIQRATDAILARRERQRQVVEEHERKANADDKALALELDEIRVYEADCERECRILRERIEAVVHEMAALVQKAQSEKRSIMEKMENVRDASRLHSEQVTETMELFKADSKQAFDQLGEMERNSDDDE